MTPAARLRRERIIEFAANALLRVGFDATNLDDIAGDAHVSKREIYRLFGSKENLARVVILEISRDMVGAIDIEFDQTLAPEDALTEFCSKFMRSMMTTRGGSSPFYTVFALLSRLAWIYPGIGEEWSMIHRKVMIKLANYLRHLIARRVIPAAPIPDLIRILFQILSFNNYIVLRKGMGNIIEPPAIEDLARQRVRFFLSGCAGL